MVHLMIVLTVWLTPVERQVAFTLRWIW